MNRKYESKRDCKPLINFTLTNGDKESKNEKEKNLSNLENFSFWKGGFAAPVHDINNMSACKNMHEDTIGIHWLFVSKMHAWLGQISPELTDPDSILTTWAPPHVCHKDERQKLEARQYFCGQEIVSFFECMQRPP